MYVQDIHGAEESCSASLFSLLGGRETSIQKYHFLLALENHHEMKKKKKKMMMLMMMMMMMMMKMMRITLTIFSLPSVRALWFAGCIHPSFLRSFVPSTIVSASR